ncbi:MAG: YihY/virulence factor BrkB family protein [Victivallaceae bacterium]|nr:YihY/virulence factor BrkB family protein [Victivallaceae bacterium]
MGFFSRCRQSVKTIGRIFYVSGKRHFSDLNGQRAMALTYYTLFAVVPLVALLFGIAKGFDLDEKLQIALNRHFANQQEILEWIYQFANTTLARASGGIVAGIGIMLLLWTVFSLAGHVEESVNAVWGMPPRRNLLRRFNDYVTILLIVPFILIVLTSTGVLARHVFESFVVTHPDLHFSMIECFNWLFNVVPTLLTCLIFFLLYFFTPNTRVRVLPALFSGFVAGIAYQAMQSGFVILQRQIFSYNHIYGSFAALPLFLIWLQWSWQIALFGVELCFVSQNIRTGLFDHENSRPASLRLQRIQQLAVAKIIFANVEANRGATDWVEIENRLGLSAVEIDRAVTALMEAGVIERTLSPNGISFLPAISSTQSTLVDCLTLLDRHGRNDLSADLKKECGEIEKAFEILDATEKKDAANRPLCKL